MCVTVLSQYGAYCLSSGGTHLVKETFENSDSDDHSSSPKAARSAESGIL